MFSDLRTRLTRRLSQIRFAFQATRKADPKIVWLLLLVGLTPIVVCTVIGLLLGRPGLGFAIGVLLGLFAATLLFGQRTQAAAVGSLRGRPGAAAAVLQSMRGRWNVQPAVAITRKQDFVHRVVGRPGVVVVGEGSPARVGTLLKQERRRVARIAGDAPVHEVSVGEGDGQVPLGRLQAHLMRLPRKLKPPEVAALQAKLQALADKEPPLPKGPMPTQRARRR